MARLPEHRGSNPGSSLTAKYKKYLYCGTCICLLTLVWFTFLFVYLVFQSMPLGLGPTLLDDQQQQNSLPNPPNPGPSRLMRLFPRRLATPALRCATRYRTNSYWENTPPPLPYVVYSEPRPRRKRPERGGLRTPLHDCCG
jgi:hypothetical protein